MTFDSIIAITIAAVSVVSAPVIYIYKNTMQRIDRLEESNQTKMTEPEVRQLLDDKLEHVRQNLEDVKVSIDKLTIHVLSIKK